jgi:hypothetical protein
MTSHAFRGERGTVSVWRQSGPQPSSPPPPLGRRKFGRVLDHEVDLPERPWAKEPCGVRRRGPQHLGEGRPVGPRRNPVFVDCAHRDVIGQYDPDSAVLEAVRALHRAPARVAAHEREPVGGGSDLAGNRRDRFWPGGDGGQSISLGGVNVPLQNLHIRGRHDGPGVHERVLARRHGSQKDMVQRFVEQRALPRRWRRSEVGEIEVRAAVRDVLRDEPRRRRNLIEPAKPCLVGMAIVTRIPENPCDLRRRREVGEHRGVENAGSDELKQAKPSGHQDPCARKETRACVGTGIVCHRVHFRGVCRLRATRTVLGAIGARPFGRRRPTTNQSSGSSSSPEATTWATCSPSARSLPRMVCRATPRIRAAWRWLPFVNVRTRVRRSLSTSR